MNPTTTRLAPVDPKSLPAYSPTTYVDFSQPEHRAAFEAALAKVRGELGREYPNVIGGERVKGDGTFDSINPSRPGELLGRFQVGSKEQATQAIEVAFKTFASWSRVPAAERAAYLIEAARRMKERRHVFSAWMVLEVGKSWAEADGDTAEAIDFLEFYAREMLRYDNPEPLVQMPGERNQLVYLPLGVGAIIPPWNFPLAILVGMTTAAIVTGNTVVLKPSSDAPAIAWQVVQLLREVGVPGGVLNFVTGSGGAIGNRLVEHPKTRFIAFTGSKEVGLGINERAARPQKGQIWIKRVVAEMGGKDSIIVAADADVDKAAEGVVASAFGFQGQKCSACSRAIVDAKVYDAFVQNVAERTRKLVVGPPEDRANSIGPVVNRNAQEKILQYIATGKRQGRLVAGGEAGSGDGFFVQPTVIADVEPDAMISLEEIFGPVLAIIKARDWEHALEIANNTEYGLTGALYTRDEAKIEDAKRRFHVGNLYFNRKCTGALVGVHPFGGFNMSGTDSKAGGRDYLLLFLQAKAMSRARQ